jgi:hypothetical protein
MRAAAKLSPAMTKEVERWGRLSRQISSFSAQIAGIAPHLAKISKDRASAAKSEAPPRSETSAEAVEPKTNILAFPMPPSFPPYALAALAELPKLYASLFSIRSAEEMRRDAERHQLMQELLNEVEHTPGSAFGFQDPSFDEMRKKIGALPISEAAKAVLRHRQRIAQKPRKKARRHSREIGRIAIAAVRLGWEKKPPHGKRWEQIRADLTAASDRPAVAINIRTLHRFYELVAAGDVMIARIISDCLAHQKV